MISLKMTIADGAELTMKRERQAHRDRSRRSRGPGCRRRPRGETFLELLISIALFAVVFVSFATVFPMGYRMNLTNLNESRALQLAAAVIEEVNGAPFNRVRKMKDWPSGSELTGFPRIAKAQGTADAEVWRVQGTELPRVTGRYFLPENAMDALTVPGTGQTVKPGLEVSVTDLVLPDFSSLQGQALDPPLELASITVRLYWYESRKEEMLLRSITMRSTRPSNLVNQGY